MRAGAASLQTDRVTPAVSGGAAPAGGWRLAAGARTYPIPRRPDPLRGYPAAGATRFAGTPPRASSLRAAPAGPPAGFSLLEVLIAMLILSVGAASLLALFAAAAATHRRAVDRTQAALVAERILSEVHGAYELGMSSDEVVQAVRARAPETFGDYRYDLTVLHPDGEGWSESELFVRVTVRWLESGADRAESFHTIVLPRYDVGELPK